MAKVLFVMKYPLEDAYSVKNKFNGQMKAVEDMGHEVWYVAYDRKHTYLIHKGEKTIIKNIWFGNWKQYIHIKAFYDMFDSVRRVLKTEKFDVAYMRRCPLSPSGYQMCKEIIKSGCKLVQEIPTYPGSREVQPSFLRRMYMKWSRHCWSKVHPMLSLYTLIGDKEDNIGEIPAINIDNGTDVDLLPLRKPCFEDDKIHLFALASMSRWHGYDRLIRGIAGLDEPTRKTVVLDMVGDEGDGSLNQWKELVKELTIEEQVVFHGRKVGGELDPFFERADVGICSLGMYRIGFSSGSILKLREYTSRGLPFVYSADDPAVNADLPFSLKIPNDDSNVDVRAVIAFAKEMRQYPDMPEQMRIYARENMSWQAQFEKIFKKLEEI